MERSMDGRMCGVSLAGLLYEHCRSPGDQEGFLLGSIHTIETQVVTDTQESAIKKTVSTSVETYIVCDTALSWYNTKGELEEGKLRKIFKNYDHQRVVGWYKFRRNSTLQPSLREKYLHQQMIHVFPNGSRFLFLLCGAKQNEQGFHHIFNHVFLKQVNGQLLPACIEIRNLGETAHNNYKQPPSQGKRSAQFQQVASLMAPKFMDNQGQVKEIEEVRKLAAAMHKKLTTACQKVAHTEDELAPLRKEVASLKKAVKEQQQKMAEAKRAAAKKKAEAEEALKKAAIAKKAGVPPQFIKFHRRPRGPPLVLRLQHPIMRVPAPPAQPVGPRAPVPVMMMSAEALQQARRASSSDEAHTPRRLVSHEDSPFELCAPTPPRGFVAEAPDLIRFDEPVEGESAQSPQDDVLLLDEQEIKPKMASASASPASAGKDRSPAAVGRSPAAVGRSPIATGRSPIATGRSPIATGRSPIATGRSPIATGRSPAATSIFNNVVEVISSSDEESKPVTKDETTGPPRRRARRAVKKKTNENASRSPQF